MEGPLWFRVKAGLPGSDGARVLERRLEVERAWSYAYSLWDWFVEKHPEGQLVGPDAAYLIARGAGWQGDADRFCSAMVAAGYLAEITEGFRVRGWEEWAGYHLNVRAKGAERKAAERKRKPPKRTSRGRSKGSHADVSVTSSGQGVGLPCDPSPLSSLSSAVASEGVQGEAAAPPKPPRSRLVSPFGDADPYPQTSAVLAALFDRGTDAAPPSEKSAPRVEAAIVAVGIPTAVERLAVVYANPEAQRPLTYHIAAIRKESRPVQRVGDLGCELTPWYTRLTEDEVRTYRQERRVIAPELDEAPVGITGPERELAELNDRWRAVAEARA